MRKTTCLYLSALLIAAAGAYADIYKCVSKSGVVTFSDQPCGKPVEIISDAILSVDEAIGNASPYAEPVPYSYSIRYDVMIHAKRVGQSIFPDGDLIAENISAEYRADSPVWTVFLSYGYKKYKYDYSKIELDYIGDKKNEKIFVRLTYIRIDRSDVDIPVPTLQGSNKVKKDTYNGWHVLAEPQ